MPDCRLAFAEALSLGRCKLRLQKKPALQVETTARQCLEEPMLTLVVAYAFKVCKLAGVSSYASCAP